MERDRETQRDTERKDRQTEGQDSAKSKKTEEIRERIEQREMKYKDQVTNKTEREQSRDYREMKYKEPTYISLFGKSPGMSRGGQDNRNNFEIVI